MAKNRKIVGSVMLDLRYHRVIVKDSRGLIASNRRVQYRETETVDAFVLRTAAKALGKGVTLDEPEDTRNGLTYAVRL